MPEPENKLHDLGRFQDSYKKEGTAPWDIGKPQPAFEAVADSVAGSLLDAGCGTGENALFFAKRGHAVTGFDFVEDAILLAKRKAAERRLSASFLVQDALKLNEWTERFDNAIDSGLFHVFSDEDRARYVQGLKTVLKPGGHLFLLCFSDKTPGTQGPRRLTQDELRLAFAGGWKIHSIQAVRLVIRPDAKQEFFGGEDPHGWFLVAQTV